MTQRVRSSIPLILSMIAVIFVVTGCTLNGADPAPLTEVGDLETQPTIPQPTATTDPLLVPTPTQSEAIDVFATQTAQAETGDAEATPDTEASEGGDLIIEPTSEVNETPEAEATPGGEGAGATSTAEPAPTSAPTGDSTCNHTIQTGENLYRIALQYGITYQELASANGITNSDSIKAGDVLNIPGCESGGTPNGGSGSSSSGDATIHVVAAGENLYRIALQYGITWQELAQYNGIDNPNSLTAGQELRIPADN